MSDQTIATLNKLIRAHKALQAEVADLKAYQEKAKKQFWYLQKVAKGEIAIGTPKAIEVEELDTDDIEILELSSDDPL